MASDIRGLVVIVTGASLGIGATYSRFLASAGVKVVMADIDESSLKALAGEIEKAGGTVVPI
ncbi:MAG: SDR family NAD(P)-dependent oxidoreductase, partial [Acidobacteria bacterium]|nr:SDR family NAD(P)-dependent oxidoreductase [Acidobacteriota bacterium]